MALHNLVLSTSTENGLRIESGLLYAGETKETGESTLDFIQRCICKDLRKKVQSCEAADAADAIEEDEDVVN